MSFFKCFTVEKFTTIKFNYFNFLSLGVIYNYKSKLHLYK